MTEIIAELENGLNVQLSALAEEIRATEEKLLRTKEGYLKVQGAIEILTVVKDRQSAADNAAVQAALSVSGAD
ncbi:hypothetical protein EBT25_00090 [bacterium]|jgi:hypothetical protein|nr:hypothetical protein [bacterium]